MYNEQFIERNTNMTSYLGQVPIVFVFRMWVKLAQFLGVKSGKISLQDNKALYSY